MKILTIEGCGSCGFCVVNKFYGIVFNVFLICNISRGNTKFIDFKSEFYRFIIALQTSVFKMFIFTTYE